MRWWGRARYRPRARHDNSRSRTSSATSSIANDDGDLPLLAAEVKPIFFLLPIAVGTDFATATGRGRAPRMLALIEKQDGSGGSSPRLRTSAAI
jgi:hypothetical protein